MTTPTLFRTVIVNEQPFTRSLADVTIPSEVTTITVEDRDQVNGWGGATVTITLSGEPAS